MINLTAPHYVKHNYFKTWFKFTFIESKYLFIISSMESTLVFAFFVCGLFLEFQYLDRQGVGCKMKKKIRNKRD